MFKFQIICLLIGWPIAALADNPSVQWQADGGLRLEMRHQPLTKILAELAGKTGISIHYSALPESPLDAVCTGPVVAVLDCLLSEKAGYILRYPQLPSDALLDRPEEIWVVGKNDAATDELVSFQPQVAGKHDAEKKQAKDDVVAGLLDMAQSEDINLRAEAIASLAHEGAPNDKNIRKTLVAALSDKNAKIRKQAVASLAIRQAGNAGQEIQLALQDSDASVRLMAVDSIKDNQQLLQQALSDSDETVHTLAAMKLKKLAESASDNKNGF